MRCCNSGPLAGGTLPSSEQKQQPLNRTAQMGPSCPASGQLGLGRLEDGWPSVMMKLNSYKLRC